MVLNLNIVLLSFLFCFVCHFNRKKQTNKKNKKTFHTQYTGEKTKQNKKKHFTHSTQLP